MVPNHVPLRHTFCSGGRHVVRPDDLQHTGAGQTGNARDAAKRVGRDGQDIVPPALISAGGKPVELQRKKQHQHQCQPEVGHGYADHGNKHADAVAGAISMDRRADTQRDTDQSGKQNASGCKGKGFGESLHQLRRNTGALDIGVAKAPIHKDLLQEIKQSHDVGIVQAQLLPQGLHLHLRRRGTQDDLAGVAGAKIHHGKNQDRDTQ